MSHIENMHKMLECLTDCAKTELEKGMDDIDTKEFGVVTDMIKDLCEACYYCSVKEAMEEYGEDYEYMEPKERRYYRGQPRDSRGRYMSGRMRRGYEEPMYRMTPEIYREHEYDPEWFRDMDRQLGRMYYGGSGMSSHMSGGSGHNSGNSQGYGMGMQSSQSGQSESRYDRAKRNYTESKEMHKGNTSEDKQAKMKELENYTRELSEDVTDMVNGASPEEKAMLKQKLTGLIQRIQ